MPSCPACFGAGGHDLRDSNAILGEHLTDDQFAQVGYNDQDWMPCCECESTGIVSEARFAVIRAESRAAVERAIDESGLFHASASAELAPKEAFS